MTEALMLKRQQSFSHIRLVSSSVYACKLHAHAIQASWAI